MLLQEAIAIAQEFGERRSEGAALSNRGLILQIQGRVDDAEADFTESLAIARDIGDRRGDAIISGRLGFLAEGRGDYGRALVLHREAFAISQALGERREPRATSCSASARRTSDSASSMTPRTTCARAASSMCQRPATWPRWHWLLLLQQRRGSDNTAAVDDTIRRCDERLARLAQLFGARYTRATALVATAALAADWSDEGERAALLAPAFDEYDRAVSTCPGAGIVAATISDLNRLAEGGIMGLNQSRLVWRPCSLQVGSSRLLRPWCRTRVRRDPGSTAGRRRDPRRANLRSGRPAAQPVDEAVPEFGRRLGRAQASRVQARGGQQYRAVGRRPTGRHPH